MNNEVDIYIRDNWPWAKLPKNIKQVLGGSKGEYDKLIVEYSVKNQIRYKGNLIRHVKKDEEQYYEALLRFSREHLMLFPYHLANIVVKGLRMTPFQYYSNIMQDLMSQEKSYDSLPNFTAADCLRLMGIGRNQYIDLMNQCRSMKKSFRKKPIREILPQTPVDINIEHWWLVELGSILEDDIRNCTKDEKDIIDLLCDGGKPRHAGSLNYQVIQKLYSKGLVFFDVPVDENDRLTMPPLQDFVMNRVSGDYFETMLYKIFVSIDDHTNVAELANILQIDPNLVKAAVSVFCRLNFAHKKNVSFNLSDLDPSWSVKFPSKTNSHTSLVDLLADFTPSADAGPDFCDNSTEDSKSFEDLDSSKMLLENSTSEGKRVGFLFDSTLTAFLMMGNLSPSLKNHAVTLFEAGKLTDEALDNFLYELSKVETFAEGEAQRYFEHAQVLKDTIQFLRDGRELDLIRCESLMGLDPFARLRLLKKNYRVLLSMAPLSNDIASINCLDPLHLGPAVAEVNSPWFRLCLYNLIEQGPVCALFVKGLRVRRLPKALRRFRRFLLCVWSHDPQLVSADNCLLPLNEALQHSAVFLQAYSDTTTDAEVVHVPFPHRFDENSKLDGESEGPFCNHPIVVRLNKLLGLEFCCGYVTLIRSDAVRSAVCSASDACGAVATANPFESGYDSSASRDPRKMPSGYSANDRCHRYEDWTLYDCTFGLPLFDRNLNKSICDRLQEHHLLDSVCSTDVRDCSSKLGSMILDFIKDFQPSFLELDSFGVNVERKVPYPLHSLIFERSSVKIWDGS